MPVILATNGVFKNTFSCISCLIVQSQLFNGAFKFTVYLVVFRIIFDNDKSDLTFGTIVFIQLPLEQRFQYKAFKHA